MKRKLYLSLLLASFLLQGCIVAAAVGVIAVAVGAGSGGTEHILTVEVEPSPEDVWHAILLALVKMPDLEVEGSDSETHTMTVKKGKDTMTAWVSRVEDRTWFVVKATSGDAMNPTGDQLAIEFVQATCDQLGMKYKVVESSTLIPEHYSPQDSDGSRIPR